MLYRSAYAYQPDGALLENAVLEVDASSGFIRELRTAGQVESFLAQPDGPCVVTGKRLHGGLLVEEKKLLLTF